ncbi:hypothetical protein GQX74_001877, partial [Glossina fuscipes]
YACGLSNGQQLKFDLPFIVRWAILICKNSFFILKNYGVFLISPSSAWSVEGLDKVKFPAVEWKPLRKMNSSTKRNRQNLSLCSSLFIPQNVSADGDAKATY